MQQIPSVPPRQRSVVNLKELHECRDDVPSLITRGAWSIPAVMWSDIVEVRRTCVLIQNSSCAAILSGFRVVIPSACSYKPHQRDDSQGVGWSGIRHCSFGLAGKNRLDLIRISYTCPCVAHEPGNEQAFKRAQPNTPSPIGETVAITGETSSPSWREAFKDYSRRAAKVAAERGTFTALRYSCVLKRFWQVGVRSTMPSP